MLKLVPAIAICSALSLLWGLAPLAQADEPEPAPRPRLPGVCGVIYGLSGRSVILPDGRLMRLVDYCAAAQPNSSITTPTPNTPRTTSAAAQFWETFQGIASPETEQFAQSRGREDVVAYGQTVCSVLNNGTELAELRQLQIQGGLPSGFDTAVTIAAIEAYCPQHRPQLGR